MDRPLDRFDELADALIGAFRRMRRREREELAPFGLTFGQARALRIISSAGAGMRIGELASALDIVPRSATTMVDGLEEAGLVTRRADPADRRAVIVECGSQGTVLLARLAKRRKAGAEQLFAPLSQTEKEEFLRLLRLMTGDRS